MARTAQQTSRDIDAWRRKIVGSDTPIFARTVSEVSAVAGNRDTSAADLSKVVGHDASMATRLLRIAGSSLFNLQGRKIDTISTAIVLIGFDAVRELAVSLALIEHVLKGRQHHRVTKLMAQAFHAAVQAKSFAELSNDKCAEEAFVSALLLQLGPMSFWAQSSVEGDAIERLVESGMPMEQAELEVLGFTLSELTIDLADEWHLGGLLKATLEGKRDADERVGCVTMGHEVAIVVEAHGWQAPETKAVIQQFAEQLELPVAELESLVRANFDEAVKIADRFGVPKLDEALPALPLSGGLVLGEYQAPDPELKAEILAELSSGQDHGKTLNELISRAMLGIHEGLGFDRTYFALLSPDRSQLQPRYQLGASPADFDLTPRAFRADGDLFESLLAKEEAIRLLPGARADTPPYKGWLCATECVLMPIIVKDKPVGVLYADCAASGRAVDDESYSAFRLFGEHIVMLLTQAGGR